MNCDVCKKPLTEREIKRGRKTCSPECAKIRKTMPVGKCHKASNQALAAEYRNVQVVNKFLMRPVR